MLCTFGQRIGKDYSGGVTGRRKTTVEGLLAGERNRGKPRQRWEMDTALIRYLCILFLNIFTLLALTQSFGSLFHSFITLCDDEYFLVYVYGGLCAIYCLHLYIYKSSVNLISSLYSVVSIPWDCSKRFTLHPLADLFIPTPTRLLWEAVSHAAITARRLFVQICQSLSSKRRREDCVFSMF